MIKWVYITVAGGLINMWVVCAGTFERYTLKLLNFYF